MEIDSISIKTGFIQTAFPTENKGDTSRILMGEGGTKDYVRAHTLRARSGKSLTVGVQGPLKGEVQTIFIS